MIGAIEGAALGGLTGGVAEGYRKVKPHINKASTYVKEKIHDVFDRMPSGYRRVAIADVPDVYVDILYVYVDIFNIYYYNYIALAIETCPKRS